MSGQAALTSNVQVLVLIRTARLWYLCRELSTVQRLHSEHEHLESIWAQRPYTFSAATSFQLAQFAARIAILHQAKKHSYFDFLGSDLVLLDPCCGSGTILYAAQLLGLHCVGLDINAKSVQGSKSNLDYAESRIFQISTNKVEIKQHDCSKDEPLPSVCKNAHVVVASLPWGRNHRIPHAFYLQYILRSLSVKLPHAAFVLILEGRHYKELLAESNLRIIRAERISSAGTNRCLVVLCESDNVAIELCAISQRSPIVSEILHGGGLRGDRTNARLPKVNDTIQVQCRLSNGKRGWVLAHIIGKDGSSSSTAGSRQSFTLKWDMGIDQTSLNLSFHDGPNWRYPSLNPAE